MKLVMPRFSSVLAAAGVALMAGAASANEPQRGFQYQSPQTFDERLPIAPEAGVPATQAPNNTCFYLNYDPSAPMGQGSGSSLGRGRLVCR